MGSMFSSSAGLINLNLSNFDISQVTNMDSMFSELSRLTSLDLSSFNTSRVTTMRSMFSTMVKITSLNLSGFDTSNVTNMGYMFYHMTSLVSLDLSNFDTSKVTDMSDIFSFAGGSTPDDKLENIYVNNDFDTSKLINYSGMFKDRKKLRGGAGSYLADPSTADESWLRIDDPGNGRPGYFTRKP